MNEANDNLVIETSDDILEDTNEKCFMICTVLCSNFQIPEYSVTRCTHEVRFIRQKKKCDVPLKFF